MKKLFYIFTFLLLALSYACSDDNESDYKTYSVSVQLMDTKVKNATINLEGIKVSLYDTSNNTYSSLTDNKGIATFTVPTGIYRAAASTTYTEGGHPKLYNWTINNITVTSNWQEDNIQNMQISESTKGKVIIKELYVGGCQNNENNKHFHFDKYVILYNNSGEVANLDNLCLGMVQPANAQATNNDYVEGKLKYAEEGWIPAGTGIWYYPGTLTIEPWTEVVIALNNAIDNTGTYKNSVNLAKAEYYCIYDNLVYPNTMYHPAPAAVIPMSHYWSAVHFGQGNAWSPSTTSPAFFIFSTQDTDPVSFATNEANSDYLGGVEKDLNRRKKVESKWILDGIEVFTTTSDKNQKRLTPAIDAGQTFLENKQGYTSYRNVDEAATKAIEGNAAKLVTNYNKGTTIDGKPSTDPSGIDAEASIKNGAIIVYQDTNNSTNDFHQRKEASLRDK